METVLGLLGMLVWIVAIMALAAGITYLVIRISPGEKPPKPPEQESGASS
jgi:hypothetical protein